MARNAHHLARAVFFLATALQLPLVPLFPFSADGATVDVQAKAEYASSLQVVMGVMLPQVQENEPLAVLMLAAPGALMREIINMGACELGLECCVPGKLYDWSSLPEHPHFRPSSLRQRIQATYPDNVKTIFSGSLITTVAALLCLYGTNKLALVGVGIMVYAVMNQGMTLSPWTGVVVSSALLLAGCFDIAPASTLPASGGEETGVAEEKTNEMRDAKKSK